MCSIIAISAISRAATPAQIRSAIEKAKSNLYDIQLKDHTWEFDHASHGDQKTGQTALAVYAANVLGESRQDPRLIPAIEYLKKTETTGVYALGIRCQVWLALPQTPDVHAAMTKDAGILLKSLKRTGDGKRFLRLQPRREELQPQPRAIRRPRPLGGGPIWHHHPARVLAACPASLDRPSGFVRRMELHLSRWPLPRHRRDDGRRRRHTFYRWR